MFITATKVAVVDALRSVWFTGNQDNNTDNPQLASTDEPYPRRITIEYPEEAHDWPVILVQIRPTTIQWTGIMPDEIVNPGTEDAPTYKLIRQGRFEATCMLQIMATESLTRDRIWDNLVSLLLMGRKRSATNNFYTVLEQNELVGLTVMEGSLRNIGDTISMGTPWNPEVLTYEASVEFDMVGTFYADEYNESLVPLKVALIYDYIEDVEAPPFEDDIGLFSSPITTSMPSGGEPVINVAITDDVPESLISRTSGPVEIDGNEYDLLENQWIASVGNEKMLVLMVGADNRKLLRVHRAQFNTLPIKHNIGTLFKHEGADWNLWMS